MVKIKHGQFYVRYNNIFSTPFGIRCIEIYTSANFAHDKCSMPHFVDVKKVCVRMMKCYMHQQIVACVKVAVYAMIKKEKYHKVLNVICLCSCNAVKH